jgi:hypothetical protein
MSCRQVEATSTGRQKYACIYMDYTLLSRFSPPEPVLRSFVWYVTDYANPDMDLLNGPAGVGTNEPTNNHGDIDRLKCACADCPRISYLFSLIIHRSTQHGPHIHIRAGAA